MKTRLMSWAVGTCLKSEFILGNSRELYSLTILFSLISKHVKEIYHYKFFVFVKLKCIFL